MYDLVVSQERCVLHGKPLSREHRLCLQASELARRFVDEYRLGLGDRYNFDVQIAVRGSEIIFIGSPARAPAPEVGRRDPWPT